MILEPQISMYINELRN